MSAVIDTRHIMDWKRNIFYGYGLDTVTRYISNGKKGCDMANGLVRGAFSAVIENGGASKRSKAALHEARLLINKVAEDTFAFPFDRFARKLLALLESLVGSYTMGKVVDCLSPEAYK